MNRWGCALMLLASVCGAPASGQEPVSVPIGELDGRQDLHGRTVRVEGRLYIWGPTQIRLLHTKAKFVPARASFRKPVSREANVFITGRAEFGQDELVVLVDQITFGPSDMEQFGQQQAALGPKDYAGHYALGQWARGRARLYKNQELLTHGLAVLRKGLRLEAEVRGQDNPKVLEHLANRSRKLLPEERSSGFPTAQAFYLRTVKALRHAAAGSPEKLLDAAEKMRQWLPEAAKPLKSVATGRTADPKQRLPHDVQTAQADKPLPERCTLYHELLTRAVEALLSVDRPQPQRLRKLAGRVRRLGPTRTDLIRRLDEAILQGRLQSAREMSDPELAAFIDELEEKHPLLQQRILDLRKLLVGRRRKQLKAHEVHARIELSGKFLKLGDVLAARELLEEAYHVAPDDPTLREHLTRMGYTWDGDRLLPPGRRARHRPQGGLTQAQVYAQFGKPKRVSHALTADGVVEQWVFGGDPPLYITFRRGRVIASTLSLSVLQARPGR